MENKEHTPKFLKQRKFMMALPLLVLPFLTFAFWILGGGSGIKDTKATTKAGLNTDLPDANLKEEKGFDKLSFYKAAEQDSLRREEALRNDPYYRDSGNKTLQQMAATSGLALYDQRAPAGAAGLNPSPYNKAADDREQRMYAKIEELNRQINHVETQPAVATNNGQQNTNNEQFSKDVDRLESMMQAMEGSKETDPEMQQLNGTLDRILDIQHPGRVKDRAREQSLKQRTQVFPVDTKSAENAGTYFGRALTKDSITKIAVKANGFFSDSDAKNKESSTGSPEAVVHETQTLVAGSTVKVRLLTNVYVAGVLVPKGTFVYGTASLNEERLLININSIRSGSSIQPVALTVYDMDGMPGIYIPGSISRDAAKNAAGEGLQSTDVLTLDPSLAAQATSAGIQATKGLLSRKVKLVKVTVKAGYKVLLRDNNKQDY